MDLKGRNFLKLLDYYAGGNRRLGESGGGTESKKETGRGPRYAAGQKYCA